MSTDKSLEHEATELFAAGQYAAAEPLYRTMLSEEPDNPQVLLMLGLCRRGQGDGAAALDLIHQSAQSPHSDSLSQFYLGQALLEQQRPEEAREALAQCISANPNHAPARTLLGYLELLDGQIDQSIQTLKTALRAAPEYGATFATLALALLKKGDLDSAYDHAQKAVQLKPEEAGTQAALGQVLLAKGHTAFAEQCILNALNKHPDNPELHAVMAGIQRSQGDHVRAVSHYARAARAGHGGPALLVDMSQSLLQTGQIEDAVKLLEQAHRSQPDDPAISLLLAQLRLDRGDLAGAETLAAGLDQGQARVRLLQAQLAERQGDHARALEQLGDLDHCEDPGVAEQARLLRARVGLAAGQSEQAEQALSPLVERDQPHPVASLMMAELKRQSGQPDRAIAVLSQLLRRPGLAPSLKSSAHQRLADLLDQQGQYAQAAAHLGQSGLRPAPIMRQLVTTRDEALHSAWLAEPEQAWSAPEDGLPAPIIVLGWPGSGRGPLMEALSGHPDLLLLNEEMGRQRANSLLMPSDPNRIATLSEDEIRQGRRSYLVPAIDEQPGCRPLEGVWWENVNLAALARFFPDATVVIPEAELADLELMWRLSGFGDIAHMLDLWQAESRLLEHLRKILPLKFIPVSRGRLIEDPAATLGDLCDRLGLAGSDSRMVERFERARKQHGLRPGGHWEHYHQVLLSAREADSPTAGPLS